MEEMAMNTNKVIGELSRWSVAAAQGHVKEAEHHARQFYHVGSALAASRDFQNEWQEKYHLPLEPHHIEDACRLLCALAEAEASQLALYKSAA
jgi:hypothetical protein